MPEYDFLIRSGLRIANTTVSVVANTSGITAGNSSAAASQSITLQSNTGTATLSLITGAGGVANMVLTSSSLLASNSSGNLHITPTSIEIANSTADVFVANTSTLTWVPNTYNFGSTDATGNGYCFLPGGIMLQWGTVLANTSVGNVLFSTNTGAAFATAIWSVFATSNSSVATGSGHFAGVVSANSTQINIRTANTGAARTVYWMAIGN